MKDELLDKYAPQLAELLPLARRAYGSRDIVSPQHDASREYTRLLVEFYNQGGSLLQLATRLGVTYAGIRRRVITVDIPASTSKKRSKATPAEVQAAARQHGQDSGAARRRPGRLHDRVRPGDQHA
jgi:hypothetical protein